MTNMKKGRVWRAVAVIAVVLLCACCLFGCDDEPSHVHEWGEWKIEKSATCEAAGEQVRTCSTCDEKETETIAALGHDKVSHAAKEASCTEAGYKAYETCSRCDYTTYEEVAAQGHDMVSHAAVEPTCVEAGHEAYEACTRCDYTTAYEEIAALGHDKVSHAAKDATCTEAGNKEYETCSRCDYTTYEEIAALGHSMLTEEPKGPTCTEPGYLAYVTCWVCGYHVPYEEIPALGHEYERGVCIRCDAVDESYREQKVLYMGKWLDVVENADEAYAKVTLTLDAKGQLLVWDMQALDGSETGRIEIAYGEHGYTETKIFDDGELLLHITCEYDEKGHPTKETQTNGEGEITEVVNYQNRYDDRGRLLSVGTSDGEGRPTGYESYKYLSDGRYAITTYDATRETIEDIVTYDMNGQALTYESFMDFDENGTRDYYEKGFYAPGDVNPFTGETTWEECSEIEILYGDDGTVREQWHFFYNAVHQRTGGAKTDAQGKIIETMTYSYHDNGELKEYCVYDAKGTMFEQDTYDEQGERLFSLYISDWDEDGVYDHIYEDFYENGQVVLSTLKDEEGNVEHRTEYEYHANGEKKKETRYDHLGRLKGWKTYDENGDPLAYADYSDWRGDDAFESYEEGTYDLDEDGFHRQHPSLYLEFDEQGEVSIRGVYTYYDNGELKEYCETDANGVIVDWESYDEQGIPQRYLYRQDWNDDGYYDYYEEGIFVWDEEYESYVERETVDQLLNFAGEVIQQTEYEYHGNGNKKSKKTYDRRGELCEWYTYDEDGAPLTTGGYYDWEDDGIYDVYVEAFFAWSEEREEYTHYTLLQINYDPFGVEESRGVYTYYDGTVVLKEYCEYAKDGTLTQQICYDEKGDPVTYVNRFDWDDDGFYEDYYEGVAVWDEEYEDFYECTLVNIVYYKDGSVESRYEYTYHDNGEYSEVSHYDGSGRLIRWESYNENGEGLAYLVWLDLDGDGNVDFYEEGVYGWHDEYGYSSFVTLQEEYDNEGNLQNKIELEYYPSRDLKKEVQYDAQGHVLLLLEYDQNGVVVRICEAFAPEEGGNIHYTDMYCIWNEEYEFYDYYPVLSIEYTSDWQIIESREFTYDEAGELILIVVKDKDGNVVERIESSNE